MKTNNNFLEISQHCINDGLQDPPQRRETTIEILGIGEDEVVEDIVFSSAGMCLCFSIRFT
jgi:hypothetical protein